MKRMIASILLIALSVALLCTPASAVTKSDLLAELEKSPVYKYVKVQVENAARNVEVTEEQAEKLLPIVKEGVALLNKDLGSGVFDKDHGLLYSKDLARQVVDLIGQACDIMGFRYTISGSNRPLHPGDIQLRIFDQNGKLIFVFDGDMIANTAVETASPVILAGGIFLLALGLAAMVVLKKRGVFQAAA